MSMIRRLSIAFLALIGLLSAACADTETGARDAIEIHPIEQILVGEIEVADLTSSSATVQVETAVDVVCSVVFGTSVAYGQQATDLDMAGGGHRVHNAPLRSLEPDTTYHYRLQGTGPDGTVYVSEPRTFQTPPADAASEPTGRNVASATEGARVAEVSSVFGDSPDWAGEHAIDGDPATEWSSAGDGDEAYLEVALAARRPVSSIGVWTRTMGTTAQVERFQVIADGETVLGPFDLPDAGGMHIFPLAQPIEVESLRFEVVTSTGGNTGLVEFAAFEE